MKTFLKNPSFHLFLLAGLAMAMPVYRSFANAFIIISFLVGVFLVYHRNSGLRTLLRPIIAIPVFFYLYLLINGLCGYNYDFLLKQLNKNLLFILVPFSILILYKDFFYIKILRLFTYSLVTITSVLLFHNLIKFISGAESSAFYFQAFTELIGEHAVYFSLYLSLGILICLDQIQKQAYIHINKWMILIFSLGLWFSASKAIILATLPMVIFYLIGQSGISFKKAAIGLSVLFVFGISITMNPFLKQRFVEGFNYDINFKPTNKLEDARVFTSAEIDEISDLELRVILGKISTYHLVKDQNLIFGYGLSDYQDYLDYYYMYYGLAPFHYEGYSPHNQFITTLVSSGLVGLFIFLAYIGYSFYKAFIKRHYLYISFLILFCFAMCFETYLLRAKGIIFFFFFNSFFLMHKTQDTKDEDRNIRK